MRATILTACSLFATCALAAETNVPPATPNSPVVLQAQAAALLKLDLPVGCKVTSSGARIAVQSLDGVLFFQLWQVPGAKSADDALPHYANLLRQEDVRDLRGTTTNAITIAGAPAKVIRGDGTEVDDGDPGKAEVVLFTAAGRVFVACAHGEHLTPAESKAMFAVLQTARKP